MECYMRFVGQTEIFAFLATSPGHGDTVRAWAGEIKHRNWKSAAELAADFQSVDISDVPVVIFYLSPPASLRISTLIDFRLGIVLVTGVQPPAAMSDHFLQSWDAHRDH
jgi:mRNA-degrading endonuclease HigB of HigAB toxin-antitoxin module